MSGEEQDKVAASSKVRALEAAETKIFLGSHSLSTVSGSVGPGVSASTFILRDGTQVKATVGHGWYVAWWPGSSDPDEHIPTAVRLTTAHGTTIAPYTASYLTDLDRPVFCRSDMPIGGADDQSGPGRVAKPHKALRRVPQHRADIAQGTQHPAPTSPWT